MRGRNKVTKGVNSLSVPFKTDLRLTRPRVSDGVLGTMIRQGSLVRPVECSVGLRGYSVDEPVLRECRVSTELVILLCFETRGVFADSSSWHRLRLER